MQKKAGMTLACMSIVTLLSACGGTKNDNSATEEKEKKEPFTLSIYAEDVKAEEFDDRFRKALEKKFPHITFEYRTNGKDQTIADLVGAGYVPDLIRTSIPTLKNSYLDLQLGQDLNPYVQKYKYDLTRFNKVFVDEIIAAGRTGELYGLPVPPFFPQVLYYNKDLFDRFGVPYPQDGMSWDEIYEIAKKMTRVDGNQVYRGFSANMMAMLRDNPYSTPILDPAANQLANFETWQTIFTNYKRFYDIPDNKPEKNGVWAEADAFAKGNVAMQVGQHDIYLGIPKELNWDIVSVPTIAGAPKLMGQRGPAYWSITKTSKHKDEAFQVIAEMLSDEIQMEDSRKGILTVLVNKDIQNALGKDHPIYSKKNVKAISYYQPAAYTPKRKTGMAEVPGGTQQTLMAEAFLDVAQGKADINTSLRSLNEKLKLEAEKAASKN
ncbi:ABC transporter substrate-binding protein [Paenibacillus hodogayensis]|uniref:ABC transporter substrate-binding protein n=1 Tax=Paenibacillus hodogayensis TaxID=279208 RepID=A0ABV5VWG3_9BACL